MKVDSALMKQCPDNLIVHDFHAKVEDSKFLSPGSIAPEIMLPDQQGTLKKLSSLRGNIVLIDFGLHGVVPVARKILTWLKCSINTIQKGSKFSAYRWIKRRKIG